MSREKKFTPGPWEHIDEYQDTAGQVIDRAGFSFIDVCNCSIKTDVPENEHWANSKDYHRELPPEEQKANANLIAAAPELLEALEVILDDSPSSILRFEEAIEKAREAISKAYGEKQP